MPAADIVLYWKSACIPLSWSLLIQTGKSERKAKSCIAGATAGVGDTLKTSLALVHGHGLTL